jgi:hypothetical protein
LQAVNSFLVPFVSLANAAYDLVQTPDATGTALHERALRRIFCPLAYSIK